MIDPELLEFLRELEKNNNKEWFNTRKADYKAMHSAFEESLEGISVRIAQFDPAVARRLGDPKTVKVFRIYRDTRFSRNKNPLKTNIGGFVSSGEGRPGYYLHVEPDQSFAGGGLYMPSSPVLKAIREEINETYEELSAILETDAFKDVYPQGLSRGLELKTYPRDYSVDHPAMSFLKLKSFTAQRPFTDEQVVSEGFRDELVRTFEAQYLLNAYLDRALLRLDRNGE